MVVLGLLLGLASAGYPALSADPGPPATRYFDWDVTATACPYGDGTCLAYGGQVPGPMLDVNVGDTLVINLTNRIAQTLPAGADVELATTRVSWHVHGMSVTVENDGVGLSSAPPGGTFQYTARAAFAGTWHYHDHVIGLDGDEGARRGLYGGLVVRNGAEPRAARVFDLHLLDTGVNGGRGLAGTARVGDDFELVVVGLENLPWNVTLKDPSGATVGALDVWPGLSSRLRVDDAVAGTYVWRAVGLGVKTGTVVVS